MIAADRYGPWAVIAGGSEGVGASYARLLARAGVNIVLLARKPAPLAETAQEIRDIGVDVRTLQVDLTEPDMLSRVRSGTAGLQVGLLIYNAGAAAGPKPFLERPLEDSLSTVRLNPIGQASLVHHFARPMVERGRGGIILVSSGASVAGCAGLAAYSASKAFTQMFGESLWAELKPHGVDVLVHVLGRTRTPALARTDIADDPSQPLAEPDDVAEQGLANLSNGPVFAAPEMAAGLRHMAAMPRGEAVELMSRGAKPRD